VLAGSVDGCGCAHQSFIRGQKGMPRLIKLILEYRGIELGMAAQPLRTR
jgi:hypothetical protein